LKKNLFFKFINDEYLNFFKSSYFLRIVILIILLSFNSFNAQKQNLHPDDQVTTIVLAGGVKLYSSDESFNNQIVKKKIIVKNAELSFEKKDNNKILIASSSHNSKKQTLAQQVKTSEEQKRKDALKQIKKKIDDYEIKSKSFEKHDYQSSPSPSQFYSSHYSTKNYITPSHNGNDFSKIHASHKDYSVKRALNYLHTQKFTYYNNKSLDFCFSEVFSVRPPPVLF